MSSFQRNAERGDIVFQSNLAAYLVMHFTLCNHRLIISSDEAYHLLQNDYSFDALQAYCFGINLKL